MILVIIIKSVRVTVLTLLTFCFSPITTIHANWRTKRRLFLFLFWMDPVFQGWPIKAGRKWIGSCSRNPCQRTEELMRTGRSFRSEKKKSGSVKRAKARREPGELRCRSSAAITHSIKHNGERSSPHAAEMIYNTRSVRLPHPFLFWQHYCPYTFELPGLGAWTKKHFQQCGINYVFFL